MRMPSLVALALISATLAACSSKDRLLPQGGKPMNQIYEEHMGKLGQAALQEARGTLRRPLTEAEADVGPFVRSQQTEIDNRFRRLPNPDLVMFVFPHVTADGTPVPGYSTVFPLYESPVYALPGEPTE